MDVESLPDHLHGLLDDELASGERVEWLEQPAPQAALSWAVMIPCLFGIPFTLFALFWMGIASGVVGGGPAALDAPRIVFSLFGIPFLLGGLAMLSSPIWMRHRIRRAAERTLYVITDRRAIIFDGGYYGDSGAAAVMAGMSRAFGKGMRITSYSPDQLHQLQRVQREDGSGDLLFGEVLFTSQTGGQRQLARAGFFSIPDARKVEELLRGLARKAGPMHERDQ